MKIDLSDAQLKLLLETLAVAWQIEHMKGKDPAPLGHIIESMAESLKQADKEKIFFSVFQEFVP
jgi:hypothetical protein